MSLNRPASMEYFDRSGTLATEPVEVLSYNPKRIGFDFQNIGEKPMWLVIHPVNEPEGSVPTLFRIAPGDTWYKDQFAPINRVTVYGEPGEAYSASEYGI